MDAGAEERLCRIDVADAGDDALIEQSHLDGPSAPGEDGVETGRGRTKMMSVPRELIALVSP